MMIAAMTNNYLNFNDDTGFDGRDKGGHAYDDDRATAVAKIRRLRAKGFRIDSLKPYTNSFIIISIMHFWQ
jgi:hypothetical protein